MQPSLSYLLLALFLISNYPFGSLFSLQDLGHKIHTTVSPVFVSQKIERDLKMREAKLPLVNQQCLVYKFESDLCDASYVGYTSRHLHQRIEEHKSASSSIGQHFRVKYSSTP